MNIHRLITTAGLSQVVNILQLRRPHHNTYFLLDNEVINAITCNKLNQTNKALTVFAKSLLVSGSLVRRVTHPSKTQVALPVSRARGKEPVTMRRLINRYESWISDAVQHG